VDPHRIHGLVDQIDRALPGVLLHVGGGEPLLDFHLVTGLLARLRRSRIVLEYVETNGSPLLSRTEEKLWALRDAGLNRLLLSISPFHNAFISADRIKGLIREIVRVLGPEGLFPWHPDYLPYLERAGSHAPRPLQSYLEHFTLEEIQTQLTSIIYIHPGGRAAELLAQFLPTFPAHEVLQVDCTPRLSSPVHAHVDHRGNYLTGFCSGLRIGREAALDLGSLYTRGISLEEFPILERLVRGGLKELFRWAEREGYVPRKEGFVSPCHLCLDLRVFMYGLGFQFPELYPDFFYQELSAGTDSRGMRERRGAI